MPLKLAAIVPHPPILIPSIGKENLLYLEKTKSSFDRIEETLREENIETIILISAHGPVKADVCGIGIVDEFEVNFEEFGDFSAKMKIGGDLELAQNLREDFIESPFLKAINQPILDHGCGVPLYSLLFNGAGGSLANDLSKKIEIVPIYISGAGSREHFAFGKSIGARLKKERKNIAVLASGDLSHSTAKNSPAGYSPRGAKFDQRLMECLRERKTEEILNFDEALIAEVKPCGLRSIAVLLGLLEEADLEISLMAYESPFGIGHLTALFKIINPASSEK
jgi:aromatic ring-opening dioxygenase LigB subunit